MPSIASDGPAPGNPDRVVPVAADVVDADAAGIGRMTAALLAGRTDVATTDPETAARVRAVVERLREARAAL